MTTTTVPKTAPEPAPGPVRRTRRTLVGVVLLVVVAVLAGRAWWSERGTDIRAGTTRVSAEGMAGRYGIDVTLVAVTAAGGLVEFRYQVVDPDKADRIVHDPELAPALVDEDSGQTLVMASPPHHHGGELELGGSYFFLLANAHNTLQRGDEVTVVIGDARLEHVEVQG